MSKFCKLITLSCLYLLSSCIHKNKISEIENTSNTSSKFVEITYKDKMEGYSVSAQWMPLFQVPGNPNIYGGPAIITFKNETNSFTITHEYFHQEMNENEIKVDTETYEISSITVHKKLNTNEWKESKTFGEKIFTNGNFFFSDVNFDSIKDLILVELNNGQRNITKYRVILNSEISGINNAIYKYRPDLQPPLSVLDDYSMIDRTRKEITTFGSGGACEGITTTYKPIKNESLEEMEFKCVALIERESDGNGNCMEREYSFIPASKKLVNTNTLKRN